LLPEAEESMAPPASVITNHLTALIRSEEPYPPLPQEEIDRWLVRNKTNAPSLLAAALLGGDPALYVTALTNFPNDPRVLFAMTASNRLPDMRRELLDRFKHVAPDNAVADYLSAANHLKNGEPDRALADLLAASSKSQFDDHTLEDMQNREDLLLQAGRSPAEAKIVAISGTLLPHLSQMKSMAQDMAELQKQYLAIGDVDSAERLATIGLQMAQHLESRDAGKLLINDLVGYAVERIVLKPLDQQTPYSFLGDRTAGQHIDELRARRSATLVIGNVDQLSQLLTQESDIISYYDRLKLYGESQAMSWLKSRVNP
jgi:hypothetical protein